MKIPKTVFFIILCIISFSACEKDDICVDGDTPLMVIEFYDVNDTTLLKDVPSLTVNGFIAPDSVLTTIENTSANTVTLPLRVDNTSSTFIFSQRLTVNDSIQADTITFTYQRKEEFVSRACGFTVSYTELQSNIGQENDVWVQDILIDTLYVNNTVTTNVKILH
ncbi:MAG: DUF6452 family protein [Flavobacteriaceae bacterium]